MSRELKVADIARRNGVSRVTAYRWLLEIEKKYGPGVVGRRGKRGDLFTTEDAFAKVAPLVAERSSEDRRIRELEERMLDSEVRADQQAEKILGMSRELASLSAAWFSRKI